MSLLEFADRPPWPWQMPAWQLLSEARRSGTLAHAWLLHGNPGAGRSEFAREFANCLLCEAPVDDRACRRCRSCLAGGAEHHPDLLLVAPEEGKKDIGIAQIRDLTEFLGLGSFAGQGRVAIIDRAERLTMAAANALLKTLEEPAEKAWLLLGTAHPGSLLATIRSRCRLLPLPGPDHETAAAWLGEHPAIEQHGARQRLHELLEIHGGQPLSCLAELGSGKASGFIELRQLLIGLLQGGATVRQAAEAGAKIGEAATFAHLSRLVTILVRGLVKGLAGDESWHGAGNRALAEALPNQNAQAQLRVLLDFQQQVATAGKLLAGPGNPNAQLLLEATFRHWQRQARPRD